LRFAAAIVFTGLSACSSKSGGTRGSPSDTGSEARNAAASADASANGRDADASASDGGADALQAAAYGNPGTVGDDASCAQGLFCLQGPNGGSIGFCTATCPNTSSTRCPGTPPGTAAYCVVTDVDSKGDKGCDFACREGSTSYPCPGVLKRETSEDPPGSGQYLCLPLDADNAYWTTYPGAWIFKVPKLLRDLAGLRERQSAFLALGRREDRVRPQPAPIARTASTSTVGRPVRFRGPQTKPKSVARHAARLHTAFFATNSSMRRAARHRRAGIEDGGHAGSFEHRAAG
jgi:hypothetical protein